jgi:hypothetical protein
LFEFFSARFEHLVVSRFLESVDHAMFAYRFLFLGTGTRQSVALGAGHYAPLLRKIGIVWGLFRRRVLFCFQSVSVNSSGLRSSIIAISLARLSTSSGDGAPSPLPCTEIFPK